MVDDDPDLVQVISINLELDEYDVIKAYNGAEALELVREERPDCVLLDIMMPVMDGWEVLYHLREDPSTAEIPVVIVTARTSDIDKIKGYGGGALEYVTKPFNPLDLKQVIDRVLQPGMREKTSGYRAEMVRQLQLATIYDITNALISTLELREILGIIVDKLLLLFDLTVCGISLISRDREHLKFAAARSLDPLVEKDIGLFRLSLEGLGVEYLDQLAREKEYIQLQNPPLALPEPSPLLSSFQSIYIFPLVAKGDLIGALTLTRDAPLFLNHGEVDLLNAICNQAAMAIENSRLYEDVRRDEETHRALLHRAITAQESERKRLAAEIHDGIIQNLVGALYRQQYAMARLEDAPVEILEPLAEVREIIDGSIAEMRQLIGGLRPPLLDDLGLVKAVERYASSLEEVSGFDLELELEERASGASSGGGEQYLPHRPGRPQQHGQAFRLPPGVGAHVGGKRPAGIEHPGRRERFRNGSDGIAAREVAWPAGHEGAGRFPPGRPRNRGGSRTGNVHLPGHSPRDYQEERRMKPIRILVVDDHKLVREGLVSMLSLHRDIEVVGQASNGDEAVSRSKTLEPDVILMDISMPGMNGIVATRVIKERDPGIKVIMLTMMDQEAYVYEAIKAGATGYLLKNIGSEEIARSIRVVHKGEASLHAQAQAHLIKEYAAMAKKNRDTFGLSDREMEVLQLLANGNTNKDVAEKLFISTQTVKTHIAHIFEKLGVRDRTEAVAAALRRGHGDLRRVARGVSPG